MPTVSHIVEKIVEKKPFLEEALVRGIVNYAALANDIRPHVEKELKKPVKHSAVMMALRRFSEKARKNFIRQAPIKFEETDITVKSDLIEITVLKSPTVINKIRKLYDLIDFQSGDFLTVTHGIYEIMIITNRKYRGGIGTIFEGEKTVKIIDRLSSLTIRIPVTATETVGLFYTVTKAINWENISIVDIVSTLTEMTFIIKEDDVPLAFSTLKSLIEGP